MFPDLCCYSCPSLAAGTWSKTQTDLSSADKNEIPGVKNQRSKAENG
jgi:hypothetical protein